MAENKDLKPGVGAKSETPGGEAAPDPQGGGGQSLGKLMAAAREQRGVSPSEVSKEAHVPAYYVRMIESDDYTLIADRLYLLPFLRRYAAFVGLDPEEIAGRFIRDVQRADVSAARMFEPIPMAGKKSALWRRIVLGAIAGAALGVGAFFAYRYFRAAERVRDGAPAATVRAPLQSPALPPFGY